MGIFFTSSQPAWPTVHNAIADALKVDPGAVNNPDQEAALRTMQVNQAVAPKFNWLRFTVAVCISIALLMCAIWTARNGLEDISKNLMTSFTAYSGIILGLLGGESQKAPSA